MVWDFNILSIPCYGNAVLKIVNLTRGWKELLQKLIVTEIFKILLAAEKMEYYFTSA
jgi:hypothetical protein